MHANPIFKTPFWGPTQLLLKVVYKVLEVMNLMHPQFPEMVLRI
jgi:hypothetical protein